MQGLNRKVQLKFLIAGIRFPDLGKSETIERTKKTGSAKSPATRSGVYGGGLQPKIPLDGTAPSFLSDLLRIVLYGIAQNNGVSDFFHRLAPLLALTLQNDVSLTFADLQITLENALGALYQLARLQLF